MRFDLKRLIPYTYSWRDTFIIGLSWAMFSGQAFKVNEDYSVFLSISDYLAADGQRLDQIGVTPEHHVPAERALEYVLTELIK
jgi:hypothetical protein